MNVSAGLAAVTVAYDLETTGLDVVRDRIVQIAAVVVSADGCAVGDLPAPFVSLVNPGGLL